jgi:hypothetical protein
MGTTGALLHPGCTGGTHQTQGVAAMGRGLLLWLLGVPIPIIILIWLIWG